MNKYLVQILLLAVFLICDLPVLDAQTVLWAKKGSSEGFDNGNAIISDDSGNVYVTGQTEFSANYDSYNLYSQGSHDILVAKYLTNGNISWIHRAGGKGGDVGHGIGVDALQNAYIIGELEDTADFESGVSVKSKGANDIFIAKYDKNGIITWANGYGSPQNDKGIAIAVTPSGNCYMTGYFSSSTTFGGTTLNSIGGYDIFIVKTNSAGVVQWARRAGGESNDRGNGIVIDASENVYLTGTFFQSATFKNTTITCPSKNSTFLAKYDSSGQFQWATAAGACCDTTKSNAIAIDENRNVYITGYFKNLTRFGSYDLSSQGPSDVFLAKYDSSGNIIWVKQAGGSDEDEAEGICIDKLNHMIYITGEVHEPGNFDTCSFNTKGFMDIFLAAYNLDGNAQWVRIYGGHLRDIGKAITVDPRGNIYSTGLFNDIADFGGISLTGYPDQPWADFYVNKIKPPLATPVSNPTTNLIITPGNCSDLNLSFTPGNGSGRIVIARKNAAVNSNPINGNIYSANSVFGNGSNLGNGNFVVYNSDGNNATITGLTAGETYYFSVVEYNGAGVSCNYLSNMPTSINALAVIFPITISGIQNSICYGDSLNLLAQGASTYSWFPLDGLSSGVSNSVIAKPISTTSYIVTGITSNGCKARADFTITVNPIPSVNLPSLNPMCENSPVNSLTGGTPAGGTYSGAGVMDGQFNPRASGIGTFIIQYDYTDANGCKNNSQSSINVNTVPVVTMDPLPVFCINGSPINLTNGNPAGGIYSGIGVNAGIFYPSVGVGTYMINYSYSSINGCTETSSISAKVEPLPFVNLGNDRIVCAGESIVIDAGTGFSSYDWSNGETTSSIVVDSSGAGLGMRNIFVIVTNDAGCQSSATIQITFDVCSGITNSISDFHNVSVFPNPFKNSFTLMTDKTITFSIYDMCGQMLDKKENVFGNISAGGNLSSGVYFLEVMTGSNRKVFSLIKTE